MTHHILSYNRTKQWYKWSWVKQQSHWWYNKATREREITASQGLCVLLGKGCTSSPIKTCTGDAIMASSTLTIFQLLKALDQRDRIGDSPTYWSSTGQHKTSVLETLLYKLKGDLCAVAELINPFQGCRRCHLSRFICSDEFLIFFWFTL